MHPRTLLQLLWPLLVVVLGCTADATDGSGQAEGPQAARVELGQAREGHLEVAYQVLGEVRSMLHAQLAAGESGEVRRVTVREGDRVRKGDLLVEVDPSVVQARMRAAGAQGRQVAAELEQAERDTERLERAGGRLVAEREIEQARAVQAQLEGRKAELAAAVQENRAVLSRLRLVAPFDGQVMDRAVDPGDWVNPGDPVLELVASDDLEVLVQAPARLAADLEEGGRAMLTKGEGRVEAEILGVVRALDRTTRTTRVRLAPLDKAPWLMAGAPIEVVFTLTRAAEDGVVVPRDALVRGAVGTRVVVARDGKAQPTSVTVLATSETEALVRGEGLTPDVQVVVRGNERLRPGQPIAPTASATAEGPPRADGS
jgi:RND family efflux transporter MFP subunit